jgi:hypothetical protein
MFSSPLADRPCGFEVVASMSKLWETLIVTMALMEGSPQEVSFDIRKTLIVYPARLVPALLSCIAVQYGKGWLVHGLVLAIGMARIRANAMWD